MKIQVDEIRSVIREEISNYREQLNVTEVGRVLSIGDGVTRIYGLANAMSGEMVEYSNGEIGQVHRRTYLHGYTSSFALFRRKHANA